MDAAHNTQILPIPLYLLAAVEDGIMERRYWRLFRLEIASVTAKQIWLASQPDVLPATRLQRSYLDEAAPWSPTLWIGPDPARLLAAARASWREQLATAQRHVMALDRVDVGDVVEPRP